LTASFIFECRLLALFGHGAMSELSPLSGVKRKLDLGAVRSAFDTERTSHPSYKPVLTTSDDTHLAIAQGVALRLLGTANCGDAL
jgi:hypothetical protein